MSKHGRGRKKVVLGDTEGEQSDEKTKASSIRATTRSPLSHAALSLASMVLATGAAAQDGALPQIDVVSDSGSQTYQATHQTITRLPTPLLDTPQTVNVVTEKVIQETGARTLEEALRTVPGITFQAGEGGQQGDSPIINGFVRPRRHLPRRHPRSRLVHPRPVLVGPRRGLQGAVGLRLRPRHHRRRHQLRVEAADRRELPRHDVTGYTQGGLRAELDASGKKDNFSWSAFAAMGQGIDTPGSGQRLDQAMGRRAVGRSRVTNQTKVTFAYIYQGEESIPDYGHPYLPQPIRGPAPDVLTDRGYFGNGSATPPVPINRSNWFGVFGGPLADVVNVDHPYRDGQGRARIQQGREADECHALRHERPLGASDRSARI